MLHLVAFVVSLTITARDRTGAPGVLGVVPACGSTTGIGRKATLCVAVVTSIIGLDVEPHKSGRPEGLAPVGAALSISIAVCIIKLLTKTTRSGSASLGASRK